MTKKFTETEDQMLKNLIADGKDERNIYETELKYKWPAIERRAKKLGLKFPPMADARGKRKYNKKDKSIKLSPTATVIPAIVGKTTSSNFNIKVSVQFGIVEITPA